MKVNGRHGAEGYEARRFGVQCPRAEISCLPQRRFCVRMALGRERLFAGKALILGIGKERCGMYNK